MHKMEKLLGIKVMFAMERCSGVFPFLKWPYQSNHSDLSASKVQFVPLLLIHTQNWCPCRRTWGGGEGRGEENKGVFSRSFRIKERIEAIVASRNSLRQSPAQLNLWENQLMLWIWRCERRSTDKGKRFAFGHINARQVSGAIASTGMLAWF